MLLFQEAVAQEHLQWHRFRFFLHPDLANGLSPGELQRRLALYVEDLNTIFAKQTIRRFTFDPTADVTITAGLPYSGHAGNCSDPNYEIWAHVLPSSLPGFTSYGGFMAFDDSCAGVAADLHWDAVHDRSALKNQASSDGLLEYCRQLHHLIHEIEHIFGAGVGEYYNLLTVNDPTPDLPQVSIDFRQPDDPFWSMHADYLADPLTLFQTASTYSNLMTQVRFADVTAAVINARVRWSLNSTLPELSRTRVLVADTVTGTPLAGALVKVWKVRSFPPYESELIVDQRTDPAGRVQFAWDAGFNNYDHLLLVKASHPSTSASAARWATIYDAQEAKLLRNEETFEVPVLLASSPRLQIRRLGETALVEWRAEASNVVLQSASSLSAEDWSPVSGAAAFAGGSQSLIVPLSGPPRFFRLVSKP